jgi:hypothetical protein
VLTVVGMVFLVWWGAGVLFDSNDALATAMDVVNADARAVEALGEPIENRLWRDDTTFDFKGRGSLRASFTVEGPRGEGRLQVTAHFERREEIWVLDRLLLYVDDADEPIDLLEDGE